jgi:archaellum component FlaC
VNECLRIGINSFKSQDFPNRYLAGEENVSVFTKRLSKWFKKPEEKDEKELLVDFIHDLESVLESMEGMADDLSGGMSEQVVEKRSLTSKILASMPQFLQPKDIQKQNEKIKEISETKRKMQLLRGTLGEISESIETIDLRAAPPEQTGVGTRIYEIAYPGETVSSKNVGTLEERLQMLENSFLTSMDKMNEQMTLISRNLSTLAKRLDEQGVKIDQIDHKITEVDSKLQKVQSTLGKISRKLTQNRTLLALLAGSVIALVIVIVVL